MTAPNAPGQAGEVLTGEMTLSVDIIRRMAQDIAAAVADHIEMMYPAAVKATTPNMLVSVKGCVFNEIIAAVGTNDVAEIEARLIRRKKHRREMKAAWRKARTRTTTSPARNEREMRDG